MNHSLLNSILLALLTILLYNSIHNIKTDCDNKIEQLRQEKISGWGNE